MLFAYVATILFLAFSHYSGTVLAWNPEVSYNVSQFIISQGYPYEEYFVTTSDGFVLGLQRIPYGRGGGGYNPSHMYDNNNNNNNNTNNNNQNNHNNHNNNNNNNLSEGKSSGRPVVLLQHGLLDTSSAWVINSDSESLAFILADQGYDVWLANSRGNEYSLSNIYYTPDQSQFWNWNWDQHAKIDIPAVINYVLQFTGNSKLNYIGHSQGATIGLAGLASSSSSSLSNQINVYIALAPVTYMAHQQSPLLGALAKLRVDWILKLLGNGPFSPTPSLLDKLLGAVCKVTPGICNNVLGSLFGPDKNLNLSRMDVYTSHWPDKTSVQNMIHWIRNTQSGNFADYNGVNYNPRNINCPVAYFYGGNDYLADVADITTLMNNTPHVILRSYHPSFAHMDFTWSYMASQSVYPLVLKVLKQYNN